MKTGRLCLVVKLSKNTRTTIEHLGEQGHMVLCMSWLLEPHLMVVNGTLNALWSLWKVPASVISVDISFSGPY